MPDFQTRRRLLDKQSKKIDPEDVAPKRHAWLNALLVASVVVVGALGYAFVRRVFIAPPMSSTVDRQDDLARKGARIQVNVLNSASGKGVARKTMDYLRARGFDVVEIGNAPAPARRSVVIDRVNDSLSAKKVAFALGIGDSCIRREENRSLFLDVTVIVGDDYESLKPWQ